MSNKDAEVVVVACPAKLNLTFEILGLIEGGYHDVRTLLQSISLFDRIGFSFKPSSTHEIDYHLITTSMKSQFPVDESNLITKVVRMFQARGDFDYAVHIQVDKNIPIAAGLAGGSANAAAALIACNHMSPDPLTMFELEQLGKQFGADVPFCVSGGTAIGLDKGDILVPVEHDEELCFTIIKPRDLSLSTPWVYKEYDQLVKENAEKESDFGSTKNCTVSAVDALTRNDLKQFRESCGNALELPVFKHYPQLERLTEKIMELGASYCGLTGSGPTLWALVTDFAQANFIREKLVTVASDCGIQEVDCWVASSVSAGAHIQPLLS